MAAREAARETQARQGARPARRRGRLRTRRVLAVAGGLALLGVLGIVLLGQRPDVLVYSPVEVPAASVGTSYAVDDQLCLTAPGGGEVRDVRVLDQGGGQQGLRTELVLQPEGEPPVIAFPVAAPERRALRGAAVTSEDLCLRLLLTPQEQGTFAAAPLEVVVAYGPGRVLRRTVEVTPPTTVVATRTGPDPRLDGVG